MIENVESCILSNISWNKLPSNVKQFCLFAYDNMASLQVRHVRKDEKGYYEELLKYSREHLMLYPYHLSDVYVKGLRVTSFTYYIDILCDLINSERSYDTLPNFTAADCLQLVGIGRNQYIDIMNRYRSSTKGLFSRRKPPRTFLPTQPLDITIIEPWWLVNVGCVTEDDVKQLDQNEKSVIDKLIDNNDQLLAGSLNYYCIQSLYRKGLVYINVPINDDDCIQVPPLENFVMNRTLGDYVEILLYKLFVSIDERTCISELASVLQINIDLVKMAVSMYCRLGFARKTNASCEYTHDTWKDYRLRKNSNEPVKTTLLGGSPTIVTNTSDTTGATRMVDVKAIDLKQTSTNIDEFLMPADHVNPTSTPAQSNAVKQQQTDLQTNLANLSLKRKRLGFLFDSTLTAFLMMGNLSVGLKNHAVTMFEVGKLSDQSLDNFLVELDKISPDEHNNEGDAQRYFDHARILKSTLQFLRYNKQLKVYTSDDDDADCEPLGIDLLRVESLSGLESNALRRVLARNYSILISMAPYSSFGEAHTSPPITLDSPYHMGPIIPEVNSVWFKLYVYNLMSNGPATLLLPRGYRIKQLPAVFTQNNERLYVTSWGHEPFITTNQTNILMTLNDALAHSPILVQVYGRDLTDGMTVFIAFNDQSHPMYEHKLVRKVHDKLNLKFFTGYICLLNAHLNNSDVLNADDDNWCLLDIRFGIPLFDVELNSKLLDLIEKNELLTKTNLNYMLDQSKELRQNLLKFICDTQKDTQFLSTHNANMSMFDYITATNNSDNVFDDDCLFQLHATALYPTQCVLFDRNEAKIRFWDD